MAGQAPVPELLRDLVRIESTPGREEGMVRRVIREMRAPGHDHAGMDAGGNAVGRAGGGPPA